MNVDIGIEGNVGGETVAEEVVHWSESKGSPIAQW